MKTFDIAAEWELAFAKEYSRTLKYTDVPVEEWKVAGTVTKQRPNKEDLSWWKENGLKHVTDYVDWFASTGWGIAMMPDGMPGIEWEAIVEFGGVDVKLIVDAIYVNGNDLIVVDYKTGKRDPQGMLQLGLYASAIEKVCGVRPKYGGYYMTRKASLTGLVDLAPWTIEFFNYQASAMKAFQDTGFWPASVGDACNICSFTQYCQAYGGSKAGEVPLMEIQTIERHNNE